MLGVRLRVLDGHSFAKHDMRGLVRSEKDYCSPNVEVAALEDV